MNKWFTVKVRYTKQLDNGGFKRVTEPYLIAALSFTDAESRVHEEVGTVIRGEFDVTGITPTEIHDIFNHDDANIWYKAKVKYDAVDEDFGNKKAVTQNFLVSADSVKQADERIKQSLTGLMVDFTITSLSVSLIVDIFPMKQ